MRYRGEGILANANHVVQFQNVKRKDTMLTNSLSFGERTLKVYTASKSHLMTNEEFTDIRFKQNVQIRKTTDDFLSSQGGIKNNQYETFSTQMILQKKYDFM